MPYLERRIRRLVDDLRGGRLAFAEGVGESLIGELAAVQFADDGTPDLATCSPLVRSSARAYAAAAAGLEYSEASEDSLDTSASPKSASEVARMNRELFAHFSDVFESFTGTSAARFTRRGESFDQAVRRLGETMKRKPAFGKELLRKGQAAIGRLQTHYAQSKNARLGASASCAGAKFVLAGGTATFRSSQAAAARSMLLYCDTLLIPDPVLAWLEVERPEEAFPHVRMLENVWHLLSLAPLVDADLPYPALIVFPSWEKLMEKHDEATRDGEEMLAMRFFSHFLDGSFEDLSEIVDHVRRDPSGFLKLVDTKQLFVAPGGDAGEPLVEGLGRYREHITKWRTKDFRERILRLSDAEVALGAILERLAPQFHARDNAQALSASPLFSVTANWHYFQLLHDATKPQSEASAARSTRAAAGLSDPAHRWLGNVPVADLVELRKRLENERFREGLSKYMSQVASADSSSMAQAATEVERGLAALVAEHQNDLRRIAEEYAQKHVGTAVSSWFTFVASFSILFPATAAAGLVPPSAAMALAAKYVSDKAAERTKRAQLGSSLLGCLAAAARKA